MEHAIEPARRARLAAIKSRMRELKVAAARNLWEHGQLLLEADRDRLYADDGSASLVDWAEREFGLGETTVRKAMQIATHFSADMAERTLAETRRKTRGERPARSGRSRVPQNAEIAELRRAGHVNPPKRIAWAGWQKDCLPRALSTWRALRRRVIQIVPRATDKPWRKPPVLPSEHALKPHTTGSGCRRRRIVGMRWDRAGFDTRRLALEAQSGPRRKAPQRPQVRRPASPSGGGGGGDRDA